MLLAARLMMIVLWHAVFAVQANVQHCQTAAEIISVKMQRMNAPVLVIVGPANLMWIIYPKDVMRTGNA